MKIWWFLIMTIALVPAVMAEDTNVTVCIPDIRCVQGACHNDNIHRCAAASDVNNCNLPYNLSVFDSICAYNAPQQVQIETNANTSTMQEATDVKLRGEGAKVDYTGETVNITAINFSYVLVKEREITIESNQVPELDKPARITFYNIEEGWHIYKDGQKCGWPTCTVVAYYKDSEILVVDVLGFSTYTIGTYEKADLPLIVIDGLGTVGAELVFWLDIIVLVSVIFILSKITRDYKR